MTRTVHPEPRNLEPGTRPSAGVTGSHAAAWLQKVLNSRLYVGATLAAATHGGLRAMLAWSGGVGRLLHALSRQPRPEDIRALLGDVTEPDARRIARQIAERWQKNQLLRNVAHVAGVAKLFPLLRCDGTDRLLGMHERKEPALLVFFHHGPVFSAVAGLARLKVPLLLFGSVEEGLRYPAHVEVWNAKESAERSALFLKRAVDWLRKGGFVVLALDGGAGQWAVPVDFMGGTIRLQRGLAVIQQLTDAPVIPVTSRWAADGRIEMTVRRPLPVADPTTQSREERAHALLAAGAQCLETCIRTQPEEINYRRLRSLLAME